MTGHDDFDRTLAGWFEGDALSPAPAGGLDRALDATRLRRPRPAWLAGPGSHWVRDALSGGSSSSSPSLERLGLRWSTALILLLAVAALVGGAILVGARLLQPSPPPTGRLGQLVYVLNDDIFVADWDGTNAVRIIENDPDAECGSINVGGGLVSPDGRHIAYHRGGDNCPGMVVISDLEGHTHASFSGDGFTGGVAWSPDSTHVATWLTFGETIGVYDIDGVRQAVLDVPEMAGGDYDAVWSPDGNSLLLPSNEEYMPGPNRELPIDGGTSRPVPADDPRSNRAFAFSPDGARAAFIVRGTFHSFQVEPDPDTLVVAAADGSERHVLMEVGHMPAGWGDLLWSPTGDRIAYVVSRDRTLDGDGNVTQQTSDLRVVDPTTAIVTTVASARTNYGFGLEPIGFSPEGDRILFGQSDEDDARSLWSANADGSGAQVLVVGTDVGAWQKLPPGA